MRGREEEKDREGGRETEDGGQRKCLYIYLYIYSKIFYEHTGHRHTYIGYICFLYPYR